eukprot:TRINITY_DN37960_c0_g1_i4.p1 TRINITY_DN37960_c0_g1~~TRINITY_DN37960_c0_g1_i4.p1  ORF type:complete len:202 (-),score=-17.73 TRINITY_DN37960_c0_g1_i4:508-1113(-)
MIFPFYPKTCFPKQEAQYKLCLINLQTIENKPTTHKINNPRNRKAIQNTKNRRFPSKILKMIKIILKTQQVCEVSKRFYLHSHIPTLIYPYCSKPNLTRQHPTQGLNYLNNEQFQNHTKYVLQAKQESVAKLPKNVIYIPTSQILLPIIISRGKELDYSYLVNFKHLCTLPSYSSSRTKQSLARRQNQYQLMYIPAITKRI